MVNNASSSNNVLKKKISLLRNKKKENEPSLAEKNLVNISGSVADIKKRDMSSKHTTTRRLNISNYSSLSSQNTAKFQSLYEKDMANNQFGSGKKGYIQLGNGNTPTS